MSKKSIKKVLQRSIDGMTRDEFWHRDLRFSGEDIFYFLAKRVFNHRRLADSEGCATAWAKKMGCNIFQLTHMLRTVGAPEDPYFDRWDKKPLEVLHAMMELYETPPYLGEKAPGHN